jgi:predicted RNase H-like nuclease (RuvC/YqgF family)
MIKFYVKNASGGVINVNVVSNTSLRKIKAYSKPIGLNSGNSFYVWIYERETSNDAYMLITVLKFNNEKYLKVQS